MSKTHDEEMGELRIIIKVLMIECTIKNVCEVIPGTTDDDSEYMRTLLGKMLFTDEERSKE